MAIKHVFYQATSGYKLNAIRSLSGVDLVQKIVSAAFYLMERCLMYVLVTGPLLIVFCLSCVILIGLTECVIKVHTVI